MKIHTLAGDLPFKLLTFPDGQRHIELRGGYEHRVATIETAICDANDLFDVLLAKDVLDANGYITSLDIRYVLAGRMDRRINRDQPFTLQVVARILSGAGFRKIRVLDPHSAVSLDSLDATPVYPVDAVKMVLQKYNPNYTVVVAPDAGSMLRVKTLVRDPWHIRYGSKHRDMKTGKLDSFAIEDAPFFACKPCLIVDDICDGGGTFSGLGKVLRDAGATRVDLFVTHGIFTKGLPLPYVDLIYTTDSRGPMVSGGSLTVIPVDMSQMK